MDLKENAANDPIFLSNVITGDETWVYAHDPETKTQSSQSMEKSGVISTKEGKASEKQHQVNVDLFLWSEGNCLHKEFVPPGQTVNAAFYVKVLKCLQENVRRKRPDQWQNNTWLLHHDNGPAHAALLT